jgi:hypothetical protein
VKAGWLIDTGEEKQWQVARTPVRIINVQMIAEALAPSKNAVCKKAPPQNAAVKNPTFTGKIESPPQIAPLQNAAQGSYGSTGSLGLSCSSSLSFISSTATGVPPVTVETIKSKESKEPKTLEPRTLEPRTLEPTPEPKPQPTLMAIDQGVKAGIKRCKDCGEPLLRGVNHLLTCSKALGLPPTQMGEADRQKRGESIVVERKTPPTATPFVAPRSADPPRPRRQRCDGCGQWERIDCTCGNEKPVPQPAQKPSIPQPAGLRKPIPLAAYLDDDIELSKYER